MKSYLKWVGNKAQLFPEIAKRFPLKYNDYYEPFVGSALVYLNIANNIEYDTFGQLEQKKNRHYLRDINKHLINCHQVVAYQFEKLIKELMNLAQREKKEEENGESGLYQETREYTVEDFVCGEDIMGAARFIYLNKRSYGGMWRENKSGMFNVPQCPTQNTSFVSEKFLNKLKAHSKFLRKAEIIHGEYSQISPNKGDFVFLDPPYYPVSKSSNFTSYSKDAWTEKSHEEFFKYLEKLNSSGVLFMATNNDVKYVRDKSKAYNTEAIKVIRFIDALKYRDGSSKGGKRETVKEIIIRNF